MGRMNCLCSGLQQPSLRGTELKERGDGVGVLCCGGLGTGQQRSSRLGQAGRARSRRGGGCLRHQRLLEQRHSVRHLSAPAAGLAGLLLQAGLQGGR